VSDAVEPGGVRGGPAGAGARIDRRTLLKYGALAAGGLGVGGLLDACADTTVPVGAIAAEADVGPGGLALARPNRPLALPIYPDNRAIASGLRPERGPLQFYNWIQYINQDVINDFQRKYGVKVQISTFTTIDEAIAKITSGAVQFDVFVPETVFLERLTVGKVLQPLNHSYLPNLSANVWPSLANPWYDVGSRYTVPYTIYTTGVGWRADHLPGFDPAKLANPWSALWTEGPKIVGKVGLLDDQHDGLTMGLLYRGIQDPNIENALALNVARNALIKLVQTTNLKFDTNEYQHLADGSLWLHQAWSGDMASAPGYTPKGTPASVLRYWWPKDGRGPINNDMFGILRGARNPVLAHLFLNHLLDPDEAFKNFSYTFYQQPLNAMTPEAVVKQGLVPPTLDTTIIREDQFRAGLVQGPLSQYGEVLWQNAWAAVKSA
jgi:spermidine/putrescine transport system substrate-binding protein